MASLVEEPPLDAAWDPDPLHAGQRVCIRLSGECRYWRYAHQGQRTGMTGKIMELYPDDDDGHTYLVYLDAPYRTPCHCFEDGLGERIHNFMKEFAHVYKVAAFARMELERIGG